MLKAPQSLASEDGGVVILTALLMPAFLFLLILVLDVGNWYVHKRHLQMQADAAALAGGAYFGDCFSPDPAKVSGANDAIKNAATAYAGNSASTYNRQVGGGSSRVFTRFNSTTFQVGSFVDPNVDTQEPCQTPHLMFDVKQTETDVPYILGAMVDALVPGGTTVVPAINARARVQLKKSVILQGSLPLAVPDVDPKHVTVTLVNENAGGTALAPQFELTKGTSAGGLNYWSGSPSVTVPANAKVGVRIGVGSSSGACAAANGIGGSGYVCFDYENPAIGVATIRGVGAAGTPTAPTPRVWVTTSCAPSGGPFFVAENVAAPSTSCSASVQAVMESSSTILPAGIEAFDAILDGGDLKNVTKPMANTGPYWSSGYVFDIPAENGSVNVSLRWRYRPATGGPVTTAYSNVQRVTAGAEESTGPIKELAITSTASTTGAPYAVDSGSQTFNITVGLKGSLNLTEIEKTVVLRLTGGSKTTAVACDGSGVDKFREAIVSGCLTPYQLNVSGACPEASPPPGPASCVPNQTGDFRNPTEKALDDRYASCPPVNWPDYDVASDPRVVKLMITDFSALDGSGHTTYPVTNFAAFYITGWTNSKCATNDPPPFPVKKGGIWGHFIKYIAPDPFSGGTEACDPTAVTPCVVSLVK